MKGFHFSALCLVLTLVFPASKGGYTVTPSNTAALSGSTSTLSCVSDSSSTLDWRFLPTTGTLVTLVSGCTLNPAYTDRYRLVNVGQGQCDLQVIELRPDRAGTYYCEAGFDGSVSSQLIAIESNPVCTVSPGAEPIYEGTDVTYTCTVTYAPDLIKMSMSWTNSQGQQVQGSLEHGSGVTTSRIVLQATVPSLQSYRCSSQFSQPSGLPSTATNTPQYSYAWNSPAFTVTPKPDPIAPLNVASRIGQSVTLQCRRTTQLIAWTFVPAGSGSSTIVVVDCVTLGPVSSIYDVDRTDGSCHLIVRSVAPELAGTYTCQDTASSDRVVSAEVIAIESDPVCSQSSSGPSIPAGTPIQFSCNFRYAGAISPAMDWRDQSGTAVPPTTEHVNTTYMQSVLTVTATSPTLPRHTCATRFTAPISQPPSHIDPATNIPDYTHSWTSTEVPVEGAPSGSDCKSILTSNPGASDGVYTLVLSGGREIDVYCDMTTDGGGWTVLQRRRDGSQNFYRTWSEYAAGFGNVEGEFWIGNDNIAELTSSGTKHLRVDLGDFSNNYRYALYSSFSISSSTTLYTLTLGSYTGDAGNAMEFLTGHAFSTQDRDNDSDQERNCAQGYRGAWWYNACSYSNLNGEYNNTNSYQGVVWNHWLGDTYSLRFSEMKIRPA